MTWGDFEIRLLRQLLKQFSYTETADRMGCSRSAVSGAVRRHIQKIRDDRPSADRVRDWRRRQGIKTRAERDLWSEARLTEPYAQRKHRLAQERTL